MRKIFICFLLSKFFVLTLFSQNGDYIGEGFFTKTIEHNRIASTETNDYNQKSKSDVEKLLFGDFNAPFEFFYNPPFPGYGNDDSEVQSGFRICRDSSVNSFVLQIKKISNYDEARSKAVEFRPKSIPSLSASDEIKKQIADYNREVYPKYVNEVQKHLTVETISYPISNQFAEKISEKMSSFIQNFKASGSPIDVNKDGSITIHIMDDGYDVTFRTVVGSEVWSLKNHLPTGTALKMSDFCRQILKETNENKFNDEYFTKLLDKL